MRARRLQLIREELRGRWRPGALTGRIFSQLQGWRAATAVAQRRGGFLVMNTHPEAFGFCPPRMGFDTHWLAVLNQRSHAAFREKALIAVQNSGATILVQMPNCPQCGEELRSGDPAGLCPKCLIQGAFESSVGADEFRTTLDTSSAAAGEDDFGRYQIVRPIGEGGMGTVYLAEQREPIRRCVALKVVKLGMDTGQVLARFANERQALAMMDHPNIARIFDAGATPKGRPYFVMEYIEGAPITQYCDGKQMTIGERLELFLTVCRAVQHAHQKGVIHRDLKPSNVLVMEQEGAPVPKVIDFGIAKATDQWAVEKTLLTQFGQMVGTPEYASPEQAEVMTRRGW